nr:TPA_asm: m127 uORF [Murid betaherpesvirus 1]DBA08096.1 TPA_asm: m127 uORF [Murid betaherpesvirus 1]
MKNKGISVASPEQGRS